MQEKGQKKSRLNVGYGQVTKIFALKAAREKGKALNREADETFPGCESAGSSNKEDKLASYLLISTVP